MKTLSLFCSILLSTLSIAQQGMYDICPIKNSEEVPNATVYKISGEAIDLKEYVGKKKAILVFYRGGWCPYCTRHLSALQETKEEIETLGYELIAITPDNFTKLDSSIKRGENIGYQLFSDFKINAINAFGVGWKVNDTLFSKYKDQYKLDLEWWSGSKHHVLPVPSIFIVEDGKINYQHVDPNYSKRLSTELLLAFLRSE